MVIPEGVTSIGRELFSFKESGKSEITSIQIPASTTDVDKDSGLEYCPKLSKITVDEGNTSLTVKNNILYSGNELILYPFSKTAKVYNVPEGIVRINIHNPNLETIAADHQVRFFSRCLSGCVNLRKIPDEFSSLPNAFADCGLTEITIPNNWNDYYECDSSGHPLGNMKNLKKVIVHEDNKYFKSVDGVMYNMAMTDLYCYPAAKAGTVFRIPDGVQRVFNLFEASNLKSMIVPASVTEIKMNSVVNDDLANGSEFESITDIYYLGSEDQWESVSMKNSYGKKPTKCKVHFVTKDSYSIKAKVTPEGSGSVSGTGKKLLTSKATLKASPNPGYSFKRWTENGSSVGTSSTLTIKSVTKARTFTAEFVPSKYTVTFNANSGTKLSAKTKSVTYLSKYGTLPTVVRSGYAFKGWYTAKSGGKKVTASTVYKSTEDKTLYAQWTKISVAKAEKPGLKNPAAGQLEVSCTSVSGAKGYQIKYATNSDFTSAKTTSTTSLKKTIKSLTKGKTYYVKVRAYKLDSAGDKVYGSYSSVAKIKLSK